MVAKTAHHPSGPLVLAISLAAVAGFVDAHLFLYVSNVFVANMSGNMIRVGIFTGDGSWAAAVASLAALGAFVAGVIVAIDHHHRRVRSGRRVHPDDLLVAEGVLVLSLPIVLLAFDVQFSAVPDPLHYVVISLAAFAMGIQASSLRRVGEIAVATTYGTGTVVRIGEKAVLGLHRAERPSDGPRSATLVVLIAVLLGYIGGAAAASASGEPAALLFVPGAVLLVAAVFVRHSARFQAAVAASRGRVRRGDASDV